MSPDVFIADEPADARYVIDVDGARAGFLTYQLQDGRIALNHAEIDRAREGGGLGSQLVAFALADARHRGLEVLPYCPFVLHYMVQHPESRELVPEALRARFGL